MAGGLGGRVRSGGDGSNSAVVKPPCWLLGERLGWVVGHDSFFQAGGKEGEEERWINRRLAKGEPSAEATTGEEDTVRSIKISVTLATRGSERPGLVGSEERMEDWKQG